MEYTFGEQLKAGAVLKTVAGKNSCGGEAVNVLELLSDKGGQGDVYKVTWNGKEYALKWYNRIPEKPGIEKDAVGGNQYRTIVALTSRENPSKEFYIWPKVVVTENGQVKEGELFLSLIHI